uniref:Ig-like domain-containing protein n=1 Tax=Erpetoichthys calabaricus TaxID=27687 RepID=A0A8C4RJP4_ERPCA
FYDSDSFGDTIMTQTPKAISFMPGDTININCKASSSASTSRLHWYQQKFGEKIKLLIYSTSSLHSETPARFSGSGSETDFTLTISGAQAEDAGDYYCKEYNSYTVTHG